MNRQILKLAIPNIISNITIPLIGIVDLAIVGHLGSEKYIGAIAVGGMIFSFLYWGFSFLRMGTTGFTAQSFGKKNAQESAKILGQSLIISVLGSFLLLILQIPIEYISFKILSASSEVESLAREYFNIRIWAAPATIAMYALMGWFIGMQNTRIPMAIALTINLLNLGFNALFVYVFGMTSDGVALGTVIAQYLGLALSLFLLRRRYKDVFKLVTIKTVNDGKSLMKFLIVGRDIFLRTICLLLVLSFITAKSAKLGDTVLAVNTILLQFFTLFSYVTDGFAYAGEALSGRYIGERDKPKLSTLIKKLFTFGLITAILFSLTYIIAISDIVKLMTNESSVIKMALELKWWIVIIPIISFASFLWDGIFVGATESKGLRNSMFLASILFFVVYYLSINILHNNSIWLAFVIFLAARGFLQTIIFRRKILINKI